MKEINEQITNLISMTWMNSPKEPLSKKYLTRFWSIDTQWMSFSDADKLIDELLKKKWIIKDNLSFYPNFNIDLENINFGWHPNDSILLELPEMSHNNKQEINEHRIHKTFVTSEESLTSKERRLARYISAKTGIRQIIYFIRLFKLSELKFNLILKNSTHNKKYKIIL